MEKLEDTTCIVPSFNEEESIEATIEEIKKYIPKENILIIDDGSTDNTRGKALEKNVRVIGHKKNRGYGAALITGFLNTETAYIAFLDADMTYHPKYLPQLMDTLKRYNLDCIWGNRFGGKENKMPFIRKVGNKMLSLLLMFVTFKYVPDVSSGERLFKKEALLRINPQTLPHGLDVITAITKRTLNRGLRFKLMEIDYFNRRGASKLNIIADFIKMSYNIIFEK